MPKRIMIVGAIAARPWCGGHAWAYLNYILGFRRLGLDVYYVEYFSGEYCVDAEGNPAEFAESVQAGYFRDIINRFELNSKAALLQQDGASHLGLSHQDVEKLARGSDVLINLGGRDVPPAVMRAPGQRVFVDLDPGYTQIWTEQYGVDMNLDGHDVYFTVGLNLGEPDCPLPTCGLRWEKTLPPVVLDHWRTSEPAGASYTTIAEWRGFSPIQWQGVWYGQKVDEFLRLIELPRRVSVPLELCLDIHPDEPDRPKLEAHGWSLVTARELAPDPDAYRTYIGRSRGEFTAVKNTYAAGRTGWFSDRSACYLAAGRPVIVQDTGIGAHVPTGSGLMTFTDLASAAEALEQVERNYSHHAAAAYRFAREYLDSDRVLTKLLQATGL